MSGESKLASAKIAVDEGRFIDAIALYKEAIDNPNERVIAFYSLGILFSGGDSPVKDDIQAEKYFSLASKENYPMATYALAGLLLRRGDTSAALASYKDVAEINPSAAYWAFRILQQDKDLSKKDGDVDYYLNLAIDLGHVHAKKIRALQRLKGQRGLIEIPRGLLDLIRLVFETKKAIGRRDKLLYQ